MRNSNLQPVTGLKSVLLFFVLLFLANFGFSQTMPAGNMYLGQAPPADKPRIFPLAVKPGCFVAERIALSNDGRDIYYSVREVFCTNSIKDCTKEEP